MNARAREYLSTYETADEFSFSISTLTKLRVFGGGPLFYKLGRRVVYRRRDVEEWIAERVRRSTSDTGARHPPALDASEGTDSATQAEQSERQPVKRLASQVGSST